MIIIIILTTTIGDATDPKQRLRDIMRHNELARQSITKCKRTRRISAAADVAFVSDGAIQMHLAQKDIHAGFNAQQFVNPVSRGHIAFRTDDIASFKQHLTANNIPFADWGNQAVAGWQQIFFYDPDGNVIEVHQVDE